MMRTWRKIITEELDDYDIEPIDLDGLKCTLERGWLDIEFDGSHGAPSHPDFTAWGDDFVFTSYDHDGAACVMLVPRNPPPVKLADDEFHGWTRP